MLMPWENNYSPSIPTLQPIAVGKVKNSGGTHPIEMICKTSKGPADYIVKLWDSVELGLGRHGLVREIYGSLLASYFDFLTPEIALIDIGEDFPSSQPNPEIKARLSRSLGLNFGSKYIHDAPIFNNPLSPNRKSDAVRVFCFDMLIVNVDRNVRKPNVFQTSKGFILLDHEKAFPF
jgi:hypothetical protein